MFVAFSVSSLCLFRVDALVNGRVGRPMLVSNVKWFVVVVVVVCSIRAHAQLGVDWSLWVMFGHDAHVMSNVDVCGVWLCYICVFLVTRCVLFRISICA